MVHSLERIVHLGRKVMVEWYSRYTILQLSYIVAKGNKSREHDKREPMSNINVTPE